MAACLIKDDIKELAKTLTINSKQAHLFFSGQAKEALEGIEDEEPSYFS